MSECYDEPLYEETGYDEENDIYQDPETGVKTIYVEGGHFMFWPCKCGHVFGRHGGELFSGRLMGCFDCEKEHSCKKFFPAQSLDKWRGKQKLTPTLEAWFASFNQKVTSNSQEQKVRENEC